MMSEGIDLQDRQYVVAFQHDDAKLALGLCTTARMAASIEAAHYSGDMEDADDRYYTWFNDGFVEVEFRHMRQTTDRENDYITSSYGVFWKGSPKDSEPIDLFSVSIDGRA